MSTQDTQEKAQLVARYNEELKRFFKDITPLFELDKLIVTNPQIRQRFIADPRGVARELVGYEVPEGHHLHFVDTDNVYYPPEASAIEQLQKEPKSRTWFRIEVRGSAGQPGCWAWCGVCLT